MSFVSVGHCAKCGAPIYAESPWWAITSPPSRYSCNCFALLATGIVTTGSAGGATHKIITTTSTAITGAYQDAAEQGTSFVLRRKANQ